MIQQNKDNIYYLSGHLSRNFIWEKSGKQNSKENKKRRVLILNNLNSNRVIWRKRLLEENQDKFI